MSLAAPQKVASRTGACSGNSTAAPGRSCSPLHAWCPAQSLPRTGALTVVLNEEQMRPSVSFLSQEELYKLNSTTLETYELYLERAYTAQLVFLYHHYR